MSRARILADYVSSGDELALKAPLASPTFTGTVAIPNVANLETAVVANTAKVSFTPDAAQVFNESGADVDFRIESDDNANMFFVDGSEDRIGIGTSTPDFALDIESTSGTYFPGLRINNTVTDSQAALRLENDARDWEIKCDAGDSFVIRDDSVPANRFIINTDGKVGMNSNPSTNARLNIMEGSTAHYGLCSNHDGGGERHGIYVLFHNNVSDTTSTLFSGDVHVNDRFRVYSNGDVYTATGTDIQSISDRRVKENIADFTSGLETVNLLKPRTFTYKEDSEGNSYCPVWGAVGTHYGFIAQEIEENVPDPNMRLFTR